jgi:cytochrome c oxidase assembly factor CtaG
LSHTGADQRRDGGGESGCDVDRDGHNARHAFFGVLLMGTRDVLGETFNRSLYLSWHTDPLADQRIGGGIAWAAGEIPLVIVMIALMVQWTRSDQRTANRLDRAPQRGDGAELCA